MKLGRPIGKLKVTNRDRRPASANYRFPLDPRDDNRTWAIRGLSINFARRLSLNDRRNRRAITMLVYD